VKNLRQNFILSENQGFAMKIPYEGLEKYVKAFFQYAFAKKIFAFAYFNFAFAKFV
jgi:hypothetical protein